MKRVLKICMGAVIIAISLIGCEGLKDDDHDGSDGNNPYYFQVGSTKYSVDKGILEAFGEDDGLWEDWSYEGYNFDLRLASEGVEFDEEGFSSGTGALIYFELFSASATDLEPGLYEFDNSSDTAKTGTFDDAYYEIGIDNSTDGTMIDIVSGSINVSKSGSIYEISINCEDEEGNTINGHYQDSLRFLDLTF